MRFKFFFKKGNQETPAVLGQPGPENAGLMLGAEEFQLEFSIGQSIDLSLRQFLDRLEYVPLCSSGDNLGVRVIYFLCGHRGANV